MHPYDTLGGWDRLVNKAQEKTRKNFVLRLKSEQYYMLYTTAILSCLPFTLICLKHRLEPLGTTVLSLGCTFIRRDLKHERFSAELQNCLFWGSISHAAPWHCIHQEGPRVGNCLPALTNLP